ncbi:hypothetical protein VB773_08345 [Haloarculaceae archaeon H-GB2-1]|nr:hypothetical protein [Haloarculaceae archaeon H-GB1-1]MEA5386067.1 hypothetical protein [Haloarculaceae archaeon H-GB11]MEA5407574.1 hypothetical protein [Haloarculaceae archaeon H-GB2-1]
MRKVHMKLPESLSDTAEDAAFTTKTRVAVSTVLTGILAASSVVITGVSAYQTFFYIPQAT